MKEVRRSLKHSTTRTNTRTGEAIQEDRHYSIKAEVEDFVILFARHFQLMHLFDTILDFKLFMFLGSKAKFNTNQAIITSEDRKILVDSLGITNRTFNNSITRLKSKQLVTGGRGVYNVNPYLIWKGTTNSRRAFLKSMEISEDLTFNKPNIEQHELTEQREHPGETGTTQEEQRSEESSDQRIPQQS